MSIGIHIKRFNKNNNQFIMYPTYVSVNALSSVPGVISTLSLRYLYVISTLSLCYLYVISTLSLRYLYVISTLSLRYLYVISTLSLSYLYVISTLSLLYLYSYEDSNLYFRPIRIFLKRRIFLFHEGS